MENLAGESGASFTEIEKLTLMLKSESRSFMGIKGSEVRSLVDVLEALRRFLELADPKSVQDVVSKSVKSWFEETKEAADVKEHVQEDCLLTLSQLLQEPKIVNFLRRASQQFSNLNTNRRLASEASNSKALQPTAKSRAFVEAHSRKPFCSFIEEYMDAEANGVIACLVDGGPSRSVISLLGPDGIGKTPIARKVYKSKVVREDFDCFAWISVSGQYLTKELVKDMIAQIDQAGDYGFRGGDGMRVIELIGYLRQSLQSKRYMFVFDDVYHDEFWHVIKQGLPDNEKGSRIIITTCRYSVVESCKECSFDYAHKLGPLSEEMSSVLFHRIAFQYEPEHRCPQELVPLSLEIIRTCRGFALPIVATAALLSTKNSVVSEWKKVHKSLTLEVRNNLHPLGVCEVLSLSFYDLPKHLRSCFMYFSIFPNDSLIPYEKLFMLWISEGFVEEKRGKTPEEVAQEYLDELIHWQLVQSCQGFYGSDRFCHIQRLIHNAARVKANELNFCSIWHDKNSISKRKSRCLLILNNIHHAAKNVDSLVHSVFLFNNHAIHNTFIIKLIHNCELLTLLDFECNPIEYLPEELGILIHLKYLSLKNTRVRKLPKSIHKLQNLQSLDVRNTLIIKLPIKINQLKNLRHLLASVFDSRVNGDSVRGVRIKEGIGRLQYLHTLMTVKAHHSGIGLIEELAKLQQLRRLGISRLSAKTSKALFNCIHEISHLESLSLQSASKNEILDVKSTSTPLPPLQHLALKGLLEQIPDWIFHLQNLSVLCLSFSGLTDDPLEHLSHLPNLVSLWLYRAYEGDQLNFVEGSFKRLMLLVVRDLRGLNVVEIEEGALPVLEELRIGPSPLLAQVPSGIEHLRNLRVLLNYDMPSQYVLSMKPDGGSDYWKVEHIPSVLFWYKVQGRSYISYKLCHSDLLNHLQGLATDGHLVTENQHELELSFCHSDDEEDDNIDELSLYDGDDEDDDGLGQLSLSRTQSMMPLQSSKQWSFSSGFYTDDIEE